LQWLVTIAGGRSDKARIFSAKDAKDAKIYCHVPLNTANDNHFGKILIKLDKTR
jgi:hypothetical protein